MDAWIKQCLEKNALLPAIIADQKTFSYADILACCCQLEQRLKVKKGDVIYIKGNYSAASVAALLWSLDKNSIVVPVTTSSGKNLKNYTDIIPANFIVECEVFSYKITKQLHQPYVHHLAQIILEKNHSGIILFTSGTTSVPKAALHDFNIFIEKYKILEKKMTAISFLNFDHVGGLNTLFSVFLPGGQLVVPASTQPNDVAAVIEQYQIELLPTTPSFLRMLLMSKAIEKHSLHSLKMISYGTEFMPEPTLKKLKQALPQVKFKQTYGSTEMGILSSQSKADDSTWIKIDIEKTPYKIQDGILWVKAKKSSFMGYLNADFNSGDDWINTQDRVEKQGEYLKILGRTTELINVGGDKVDPHEVETVLLQCEGVRDAIVFGKSSPVLGQVVMATISYQAGVDPHLLKKKIHDWSVSHLEVYKRPAYFIIESDIAYSSRWKKRRESHG